MRAPAIQLYYRDWMSHPGLRMCSIAARGLFADMMCIMAEGTPYGYLKVGSKDILPPVLARRVGESLQDVERWLAELEEHDVFQRDDSGSIYSTRMVEVERVRQARAAGGVKSQENPKVPRKKDTPKDIHAVRNGTSFRPSPAVAVAVAVASASNSTSSARVRERLSDEGDRAAFDVLLSRVPEPTTWAAECEAMLDGMDGHHRATPVLLGRAIRDLTGNGKLQSPNLRQFRRYVRDADDENTPRTNGNGNHKSVAEQGYNNAKLAIQDL